MNSISLSRIVSILIPEERSLSPCPGVALSLLGPVLLLVLLVVAGDDPILVFDHFDVVGVLPPYEF